MKVSELTGDRSFTILSELIDPMKSLVDDPEISKYLIHPYKLIPEGQTWGDYRRTWTQTVVVPVMAKYGKKFIPVFAVMYQVSEKEYADNMTTEQWVNDFTHLVSDPVLNDVFFSAEPTSEN